LTYVPIEALTAPREWRTERRCSWGAAEAGEERQPQPRL